MLDVKITYAVFLIAVPLLPDTVLHRFDLIEKDIND